MNFIHGYGSVSPAGFGTEPLLRACRENACIPDREIAFRPGSPMHTRRARVIEAKTLKKELPKHPRLRRASPITWYAMHAVTQALGAERMRSIANGDLNIGLVFSLFNGCVNYSKRFYQEVLDDPEYASPLIFPETVFNAPASHVAAVLGITGPTYSLIGDSCGWFSALAVGQNWIQDYGLDGCLIICAEEHDWLTAEGACLHEGSSITSEGAAAIYLSPERGPYELVSPTSPISYTVRSPRDRAAAEAASALKDQSLDLIVGSMTGIERYDRVESKLLAEFRGIDQIHPDITLGLTLGARGGLQTAVALESLQTTGQRCGVYNVGNNQQAASVIIERL